MDPARFCSQSRLVIVAGKGGVGKTTVTAALSAMAARAGLKTLIVEVEGKSGLMSALVEGRYDMVPIPDAKLGSRKVDVATTYNTERYRPIYSHKRGLPIFLNRAS